MAKLIKNIDDVNKKNDIVEKNLVDNEEIILQQDNQDSVHNLIDAADKHDDNNVEEVSNIEEKATKSKGIMTKLLSSFQKDNNTLAQESDGDDSNLGETLTQAKAGIASENRVMMDAAGLATGIEAFEEAQNEFDATATQQVSQSQIDQQGINNNNVNDLINAASQGSGDDLYFDDEGEELDNSYAQELYQNLQENLTSFDTQININEDINDPLAFIGLKSDPAMGMSFEFANEDSDYNRYLIDLSQSPNNAIQRITDFNDGGNNVVAIFGLNGNLLSRAEINALLSDEATFRMGNDGASYYELIFNQDHNGEHTSLSLRFYGIDADAPPEMNIDNFETSDQLVDAGMLSEEDDDVFKGEYQIGDWAVSPFNIDTNSLAEFTSYELDGAQLIINITHGLDSEYDMLTLSQDGAVTIDAMTFGVAVNGRNIGFIDVFDNGFDGQALAINFNHFCHGSNVCEVINATGFENHNFSINEQQSRRLDAELLIGGSAALALVAAVAVKPQAGQVSADAKKDNSEDRYDFEELAPAQKNENDQQYKQKNTLNNNGFKHASDEFTKTSAVGEQAEIAQQRKREQRDNRLISMISKDDDNVKNLLSAAFLDDYEEMDKRELHNIDANIGLSKDDVSNLAVVSAVLKETSHIEQKAEEEIEIDDNGKIKNNEE